MDSEPIRPRRCELKRRARELARSIMGFEEQCEESDGLSPDALEMIAKTTLAAGLNAINMPVEWGGAGLSILDQVLVQEELGQLTNALWDAVWRPANASGLHARAARALPHPRHQGRAPRLLRRDRGAGRLGLHGHRVDGRAGRGRLPS